MIMFCIQNYVTRLFMVLSNTIQNHLITPCGNILPAINGTTDTIVSAIFAA